MGYNTKGLGRARLLQGALWRLVEGRNALHEFLELFRSLFEASRARQGGFGAPAPLKQPLLGAPGPFPERWKRAQRGLFSHFSLEFFRLK